MANLKEIVWGAATIVAAGIVFAAYLAAPPRFSIARMNDGAAYRMDGHSGEVSLCFGFECRPVSEIGPAAQTGNAAATAETVQDSERSAAWSECVANAKDAVEAVKCQELK